MDRMEYNIKIMHKMKNVLCAIGLMIASAMPAAWAQARSEEPVRSVKQETIVRPVRTEKQETSVRPVRTEKQEMGEEPVIITAPDTVIDKTAYSFSEQGVTVAVAYGSAYPAGHQHNNIGTTYFAVLAESSLTISAETNIKGVAINGWVKKNFTATCDHGTINYLSDDEDDATGEPVLTITDVDNQSVTIQCAKQLRCFSVEVYFSENPEAPQSEVMDTVRLTMVNAEAQDYSEDSTYSQEGHYSYWLMLEPEDTYPQIWLDMYAAVKGDLSGSYSMYDYNVGNYTYVQLGASEIEYEYAYDQAFTITKDGENYHVEGYIIGENDVQYEFVYDGPIALKAVDEGEEEQGIENAPTPSQSTKILRDGALLIERNGKVYSVLGAQL